jgi:hypothetical protein
VITHDRLRNHGPEIAALAARVNGLLHPRGDARALADCAAALLVRDDLRALMSAAAYHTVSSRYNLTVMVARFHAAIRAAGALPLATTLPAPRAAADHAHRPLH